MLLRGCTACAILSALLFFGVSSVQADDTLNLLLKPDHKQADQLQEQNGEADTIPVHGYRRFYRGRYYSYSYPRYRYYSYSYPRYRTYAYRPLYRYNYSYPRYSLSFGFSYSRPSYYYAPRSFYYGAPSYYCPIGGDVLTFALPGGSASYSVTPANPPAQQQTPQNLPKPTTPQGEQTYPYDGGPQNPVPMPKAKPQPENPGTKPAVTPPPSVPLEGRPVSLPATPVKKRTKFAYPAYGETLRKTTFAKDRVVLTKGK